MSRHIQPGAEAVSARESARKKTTGRFGFRTSKEPAYGLLKRASGPSVDSDYVQSKLDDLGIHQTSSDHVNEAIASRLNESRNFTDENIRDVADEVWREAYGYTPAQSAAYDFAVESLYASGETEAAQSISEYVQAVGSRGTGLSQNDTEVISQSISALAEMEVDGGAPADIEQVREMLQGIVHRKADAAPVTLAKRALVPEPNGRDDPVPYNDPRVQNGEIFDNVIDEHGTHFSRSGGPVTPDRPYQMRLQASRPLSPEEAEHLAQLMGYQYAQEVRGESLGTPRQDTPYSFIVHADTTKSSSGDIGDAMWRFEEGLSDIFKDGSTPRKTTRTGPIGSQLVPGFNDPSLTFEMYYDAVHDNY